VAPPAADVKALTVMGYGVGGGGRWRKEGKAREEEQVETGNEFVGEYIPPDHRFGLQDYLKYNTHSFLIAL